MSDEDKKVSPARQKKEQLVAEIATRLEDSSGLVLTNYQGLTHKQIEQLKKQLKEVGSTFSVTKNSLLKLSLDKVDKFKGKISDDKFVNPTAVVFISGDYIEALKKVMKANKDFGFPKVKLAVLEGSLMDEAQIIRLSSLPSRQVLIAQLVGTLNSPIQGLVVVLNGNLQKLVMALNAIAIAKA